MTPKKPPLTMDEMWARNAAIVINYEMPAMAARVNRLRKRLEPHIKGRPSVPTDTTVFINDLARLEPGESSGAMGPSECSNQCWSDEVQKISRCSTTRAQH